MYGNLIFACITLVYIAPNYVDDQVEMYMQITMKASAWVLIEYLSRDVCRAVRRCIHRDRDICIDMSRNIDMEVCRNICRDL